MTVENNITKKNGEKPKITAPEGGWGYAIAISMVVVFIASFSQFHSMGLLYGSFFNSIGHGVQGFTILMGVMNINVSMSGMIANVALKRFSIRTVGYAGTLMVFLGWFLTAFVTSLWQILITVGVIQALGLGIIMTVSLTSFNQYFDKKRMSVISYCKVVIGLGNMAYPLLITFLLDTYGFRGTILIQSGIVLQMFIAVCLLQPVEWHQKKNNIIGENINEKEEFLTKPFIHGKKELLGMSHHHESDEENNQIKGRARALSIVSNSPGVPSIEYNNNKEPSIWKSICKLLDLNLFKDPIFFNICFGVSLACVVDWVFFSIVPLQMAANKFPQQQVAYCLSVVSAADLICRGFIGFIGHYVRFTSRTLCSIGIIGSFIFRILYLYVDGFIGIMIVAGILGFLRCPIAISATIIYAEYIPEKFAAAFALQTLLSGIMGSIVTPLTGLIKDVTQDYVLTFHILNSLSLLIIIPWFIEFYIMRGNGKAKKSETEA